MGMQGVLKADLMVGSYGSGHVRMRLAESGRAAHRLQKVLQHIFSTLLKASNVMRYCDPFRWQVS